MIELITWIQEQLGGEATKEDAQVVFDYLRNQIVYDRSGHLVLVDDTIDLKAAFIAATASRKPPTH